LYAYGRRSGKENAGPAAGRDVRIGETNNEHGAAASDCGCNDAG